MDYEKEYNHAFEIAKGYWGGVTDFVRGILESMFPQLAESEDEKIMKEIIEFLDYCYDTNLFREEDYNNQYIWRRWLKKQTEQNLIMANSPQLKEQKSLSTEETELNSIAFLEQLGYTCVPPQNQAPVAFTKEDEVMWQNLIGWLEGHFGLLPGGKEKFVAWLKERFVKFAYPKPGWKPSEEQMNALLNLKFFKDKLGHSAIGAAIDSLYEDLEKLIHE